MLFRGVKHPTRWREVLGADSFSTSELCQSSPHSVWEKIINGFCPIVLLEGLGAYLRQAFFIEEVCLLYLDNSPAFSKGNSQREKKILLNGGKMKLLTMWKCKHQKRPQYWKLLLQIRKKTFIQDKKNGDASGLSARGVLSGRIFFFSIGTFMRVRTFWIWHYWFIFTAVWKRMSSS